MNEVQRAHGEISIAHFVKEVNDRFGQNGNILQNVLFEVGVDLAEIIQALLDLRENLRHADSESTRSTTPIAVDRDMPMICPELLGCLLQF